MKHLKDKLEKAKEIGLPEDEYVICKNKIDNLETEKNSINDYVEILLKRQENRNEVKI